MRKKKIQNFLKGLTKKAGKNKLFLFAITFFFLLDIALVVTWLSVSHIQKPKGIYAVYPEMKQLTGNEDYDTLKSFLVKLAQKKGGVYAYHFLLNLKIKPGVDIHLLGHAVGEQIYIQDGVNGMEYCTADIQNACSHAIIVGFFSAYGDSDASLKKIDEACKRAPGGPTAYYQCYHGLGHGVLSYYGYNLKKAMDTCGRVGLRQGINCGGGAVMEITDGGFHDPVLWKAARGDYIKDDDPLSPCNTDVVPADRKPICYIFLTPHLEEVARKTGTTEDEVEKIAFTYCNAIPQENVRERDGCFGGFGKEFAVLATGRGIRDSDIKTNEGLRKAYNWCTLAEDEFGIRSCLSYALNSYYWGGENTYATSTRFCNLIKDDNRKFCFDSLIGMVYNYKHNSDYFKEFCKSLPQEFQNSCQEYSPKPNPQA